MTGSEEKSRRQIRIEGPEGQEETPAIEYRRAQPRAIADALGLDKDETAFEGQPQTAEGAPVGVYHPDQIRAFIAGQVTLGDLEGISKEEQYQVADLAFRCLGSGKLDEAEQLFAGLLALDPFDAYFLLALGSIAHQRGDHDAAEEKYSRCLQINPFSASAHAHRGEIRITTGRLADGTDDLVKALELDPGGQEPATHRARATVRVLQEKLGTLDREELERLAESERKDLAEAEQIVEEALAAARAKERAEQSAANTGADGVSSITAASTPGPLSADAPAADEDEGAAPEGRETSTDDTNTEASTGPRRRARPRAKRPMR